MRHHTRLARIGSAFLTVLLLSGVPPGEARPGGARDGPQAIGADAIDPAVAVVNGEPIPAKLFRMYVRNGIEALGIDRDSEGGRRQIEQLQHGVISELIDRAVVEIEARRRGITIAAEALDARARKWIAQMGGEAAYRTSLAEHGITDEEFRRTIAQEIYGERLNTELTAGLRVEETEIGAFYAKEKSNAAFAGILIEPERVAAAHILIAARPTLIARELQESRGLSGETLAAAVRDEIARRRERAEELRRQAADGADFAALARQWSDDPASRDQGGSLGRFTRNTHTAAFDEAAFALPPGQISPVVRTDYGFHIIAVAAHTKERMRTLDEARPLIRERLIARKRAASLGQWLAARRRAFEITVNPDYRRDDSSAESSATTRLSRARVKE